MGVGHDIIRRQQFFRKELRERVHWFIKLRWMAVLGGLCGCGILYVLEHRITVRPLVLTLAVVGLCNALYLVAGRRLEESRDDDARPYEIFAHVQTSLDLAALFILIYFTGGVASPLLCFVFFHIVLAGILLSPLSCYVYAVLVMLASGGLTLLRFSDSVPYWTAWPATPFFFHADEFPGTILSFLSFSAGLLVTAFLTTSLKSALRSKAREVMKVSRELEEANVKLALLYEMIKEVDSYSDLGKLMDSAVRNAARIMGVKAASIKLLDEGRNRLKFAAAHGLSEDYLAQTAINIEESAINRKILEGSLYSIGHVDQKSAFQYPENIIKEGIESILCLPLQVGAKILGVFCVYSGERQFFSQADADFFSLMTDLTALAMESLIRQTAKNWFLNKTAHHLRSPINTIQSMLHLLEQGYLGPLQGKQAETVTRCHKRLSILQDVINDLLKLASGRQETGPRRLESVDIVGVVAALEHLFRALAKEKELDLQFLIPEALPPVLGRDNLLDELAANLISNALKYTPPGGLVQVSIIEYSPELVRLEVRDTGIGISEPDQHRLFTEFFRAENAKAQREEGTGLGLVIVKEILDEIGGSIQIKSQLGKGTTVDCLIPYAKG
ncbi:MAG: ATP-binding protein [Pseudomonadota bacterium]